jgi:hypothetical protein
MREMRREFRQLPNPLTTSRNVKAARPSPLGPC